MTKVNYSFIIPHHNCAELLSRCIDSIPQREDVEIIVVDDNSCPPLSVSGLRDDVILITISKDESKGAGRARNIGMAKATGKWLLFADCDDYYTDNLYHHLDKFKDSSYDIVYFDVHHSYDITTKAEKKSLLAEPICSYLQNKDNLQAISNLKHAINNPWNKMVSRDYVRKINAQYHEVPVCNDGWFSHYIAIHTNNIAAINEKLYYWVLNPNGMTNKLQTFVIEKGRIREGFIIRSLAGNDACWNPKNLLFQGFNRWHKQLGFINAVKLLFYRIYYRITIH